MSAKLNTVYRLDSRKLDQVISSKIISVTITSPPYFDLKDYGNKNQIGFGQKYDDYLNDLSTVFKKVYDVTKENGSLWVIIDTYKKDKKIVPLPFDFSKKMDDIGWNLRDIIIWNKDRTLPWSHKGKLRNIFEYILVFSKSSSFKYQIDRVREYDDLKKWWVKYPERYNPNGKAPSEIWNYNIPTQGSWGKGYIKHFCPLPEELVRRIILLTTNGNDIVLDPFSGSGTVPAQANFSKRKFIGFEINEKYIKMFWNYFNENKKKKRSEYEYTQKNKLGALKFRNAILKLRALKFAKILIIKTNEDVLKIHVGSISNHVSSSHKVIKVRYNILLKSTANKRKVSKKIKELSNQPPLSKFGIEEQMVIYKTIRSFNKSIPKQKLYTYTIKNTHSYVASSGSLFKLDKYPIISNLRIKIDEKSFNY